jgi:hypothetical protein
MSTVPARAEIFTCALLGTWNPRASGAIRRELGRRR